MKSIFFVACVVFFTAFANVNATSLDNNHARDAKNNHKPVTPEDLNLAASQSGATLNNSLVIRSKQSVPLASLDGTRFSYYGETEQEVEYTHDTTLNSGEQVSNPGFYVVGSIEVDETGRYTVPQLPKHLKKDFLYLYSSTDNSSAQFDKNANSNAIDFYQEKPASADDLKSYAKGNHLELDCYMDCPQTKDTQFAPSPKMPKQPLISYVLDISSMNAESPVASGVDLPKVVSEGEELIKVNTAPMVVAGTAIDSKSSVWTQDVSFVWTKTVVKLPLIAAAPTPETSSNEDREHLYPFFAMVSSQG